MSATTWMPLYPADYLADTRRLTTEQHGAYLLLLMDSWVSGALPDDDAVLARVAGLELARWRELRPVIEQYFVLADGQWRHSRIEREREHAQAHAQASIDRAKKAAASRWGKKQPDDSTEKPVKSVDKSQKDASSNAQALLGECPPPPPIKTSVVIHDVNHTDSSAQAVGASSFFVGDGCERGGGAMATGKPADGRTRAGELCAILRKQGLAAGMDVRVQPGNPQVAGWVSGGVTDDEAAAALETALLNRQAQSSAQPITAGYLNTIIAAGRAAKSSKGAYHGAHQSRATAAAEWGAEFAAAMSKPEGQGGRCIDGEAVVIDTGQADG